MGQGPLLAGTQHRVVAMACCLQGFIQLESVSRQIDSLVSFDATFGPIMVPYSHISNWTSPPVAGWLGVSVTGISREMATVILRESR